MVILFTNMQLFEGGSQIYIHVNQGHKSPIIPQNHFIECLPIPYKEALCKCPIRSCYGLYSPPRAKRNGTETRRGNAARKRGAETRRGNAARKRGAETQRGNAALKRGAETLRGTAARKRCAETLRGNAARKRGAKKRRRNAARKSSAEGSRSECGATQRATKY